MTESANIPSHSSLIHVSGEAKRPEGDASASPSVLPGGRLFARDDSPIPVGCGRTHAIPRPSRARNAKWGEMVMMPVACGLDFTLSPPSIALCRDCRPAWIAMNPITVTEERSLDDLF